jgi:4-hydroxybenzoate polyprenyltransferase
LETLKKFVPQTFNDLLALLYFPFILIWIVLIAIIYKYVDINMIEALGLGTATGIILSKFNDIYQFYFRKSKD